MQPRYWRRAWRTGHCVTRLSGLTLTPSTAQRGVDVWMASLGATRASRSLSLDSNEDPTTHATSFAEALEKCLEISATSLADAEYVAWLEVKSRGQARGEGDDD